MWCHQPLWKRIDLWGLKLGNIHLFFCLQVNNIRTASIVAALSVISFSIEQSSAPQITHKRSENLADSGNCLDCIINIAWYLQEKEGYVSFDIQRIFYAQKSFLFTRVRNHHFNLHCSTGPASTKTFHPFDTSPFQRRFINSHLWYSSHINLYSIHRKQYFSLGNQYSFHRNQHFSQRNQYSSQW